MQIKEISNTYFTINFLKYRSEMKLLLTGSAKKDFQG